MTVLSHTVQGDGPPLVFIHGWGVNDGVWAEQVAHFSKQYKVITIRFPGHGAPALKGQTLSIFLCAEMLCNLLTSQDIRDATLIGWSLGSEVAIRTALTLGEERISRLVLVGGTPCYVAPGKDDKWGMPEPKARYFKRQLERDFRAALGYFILSFFEAEPQITPERTEEIKQLFFNGNFPPDEVSAMQLLESLYTDDLREDALRVTQPCLICHGERDIIVPVYVTSLWDSLLQKPKTVLFEDCGHAPFLTWPDRFKEAVEAFLRGRS